MAVKFHQGQRLSYGGELCTVRYQGSVEGTRDCWLGVEWDDPSRGKHDGTHRGKKYFDCLSKEPNAASFIRLPKQFDSPRNFFTAMGVKYGSEDAHKSSLASDAIFIGGKEVDEVGFTLITQKQSAWSRLRIISLDGLRLNGICSQLFSLESRRLAFGQILYSEFWCDELDLSRNLFEVWLHVVDICSALPRLRVLKLNGNRFKRLRSEAEEEHDTFNQIAELSLANIALRWDTVLALCTQRRFPKLQVLSLAFNPLDGSPNSSVNLLTPSLTRLDLTSCNITSLQPLAFLSELPNLLALVLRSNPLATLSTDTQLIFPKLLTLDLTSTLLATTSDLGPVPKTFPILCSIQTSHTPLATSHPSSRLLTIARLPQLATLNNTTIPFHERTNAELYYLKLITSLLLAAETPEQEQHVLSEHTQWSHLCSKHGEPESILEKKRNAQDQEPPQEDQEYPPMSLGAHLCAFTFYTTFTTTTESESQTHTRDLPLLIDIYALKGIVGRAFSLPPMSLRLILETDEWDPVPAAKPSENDWSCSEDEDSDDDEDTKARKRTEREERKRKLWIKREVELMDSTRKAGDWVEGRRARVRVEMRE
ncbi:MAG: hypothetical protein Q9225_001683 [Loekoesia sp. 1 TL-2023]